MTKKIDSIQKLNKKDLKKSRRIILNLIGESDSEKKIQKEELNTRHIVANILPNINTNKNNQKINSENKKINPEETEKQRKILQEEINFKNINNKQEKFVFLNIKDKDTKEYCSNSLFKSSKKQKAHNTFNIFLVNNKKVRSKYKSRNVEQLLKLKQKKTKRLQEKIRKEEKEKKRHQKEEEKLLRYQKKVEYRRRRIRKIRHKIKNLKYKWKKHLLKLKNDLKYLIKIFSVSFVFFVIGMILGYLVLAILLLKFNLDNKVFRRIEYYFSIPAFITDFGWIDYYDYIDEKKKNREDEYAIKTRTDLLEKQILAYLAKKHHIQANNLNELKKKLEVVIIYDSDVNKVGIKRIRKIKELIKKENNFVNIAMKYGDRQGKADYKDANQAAKKFGPKIKKLKPGEVSDILILPDGYYIARRYKKDGFFALSYVFVKAKSLDEYLDEKLKQTKIFSLVDF